MATHGHLYSYSISIVRTSLKQRLEMVMRHDMCDMQRHDEEEHRLH